jgi:3-hydroxybutyryl-CoA dehydratase
MPHADLPLIGQGAFWQDLPVGWKARTGRRTVTESDLIAFVSATGMLEAIFIDGTHQGLLAGRPVPAALTLGFIEGMQLQSLLHGTGLALLELSLSAKAPVCVGMTIWAVIEVIEAKPTSRNDRSVVTFSVDVFDQDGSLVLHYDVKRMIAGRQSASIPFF